MNAAKTSFGAAFLAILSGWSNHVVAQGINTPVEICIEFQTNYTDLGGDWWTSALEDQPGRGVWLSVVEWSTGDEKYPPHYTDWVPGNGGCATVTLNTAEPYLIFTESRARVNDVWILSYDDILTPELAVQIHDLAYVPTVGASLTFHLPATTQYGQLAVATWAFYRNNAGLSGSVIEFFDDDCCSGGAYIQASDTSKFIIAHELGHGVAFRRDWEQRPRFNYTAAEDGCDGDNVDKNKHAQISKEFQSAAAVEGWGDFYAAWLWNRNSESNCVYDRHYSSDFDLDGTNDTANGQVSCEGSPTHGIDPSSVTDSALPNVTARDWLEDVTDAGLCSGSLTNRGTQYDWLRFWWDMVTDENVPFETLVSVHDEMDPRSFDGDGSTLDILDDPAIRLVYACATPTLGLTAACSAQDNNGADH